jgi:3-deoxy-D-manno-octulosonic-acid transferase
VKRLVRAPFIQDLLARLIAAYGEVLIATWRWRLIDFELARKAVASDNGLIGLFWHGRIAHAIACRPLLGAKPRRVMISHSRDGAFIAKAAERLDVPTIRGSTGREGDALAKGGAAAFRAAVKSLGDGAAMLITPDGPRGPARIMPTGPVHLARAAKAPVFALGLTARPAFTLKSWDGARLPLPFARAVLVVAGPFKAPLRLDDAGVEDLRRQWQDALNGAQARAEALIAERPIRRTPGLHLYGLLTWLAEPLLGVWLRRRMRAGKEDPGRWREKLGHGAPPRPDGPLVWLHGVSVGESLALLPLAQAIALERPDARLLVTSATRASADLVKDRLPPGASHQFAPLDVPGAVGRFLDHWRPDLGVLAESEIWPNLILGAKIRGTRLALVSARLSASALKGWRRAPGAARAVFSALDLILARDADAARDLEGLGAKVQGLVNLKFGAPPPPIDPAALETLRAALLGRRVLLAASTHPGEDTILLDAFQAAGGPEAGARLIVVPRHVDRGPEVEALARSRGLSAGRRTADADPRAVSVYIADTLGELGLYYSLADLSVLGGSLIAGGAGGHNPLEPARLGRPFLAGPHVQAWPLYDELVQAGATRLVAPEGLASAFHQAIVDPRPLQAMASRAQSYVREGDAGATAALAPILALIP